MIDFSKEKEVICIKEIDDYGFKIGHRYVVKRDKYNGEYYVRQSNNGIAGIYLDSYYNDFFKKVDEFQIKTEADYYTWLAKR